MAITLLAGTTVGSMVSSEATTALNGLTGGLSSGLMGFFNSSISGTIGAVLSNGFNLSCWGASMTPALAKERTPKDIEHILKHVGIDKAINLTTVNKFIEYMNFYIERKRESADNGSNSSCTRDGNAIQWQTANSFYKKTMAEIKKSYTLGGIHTIKKGNFSLNFSYGTLTMAKEIWITQYTSVTPISQATSPSTSGSSSTSTSSSSSTSSPDSNVDNADTSGGGSLLKTLGIGILGSIIASKI